MSRRAPAECSAEPSTPSSHHKPPRRHPPQPPPETTKTRLRPPKTLSTSYDHRPKQSPNSLPNSLVTTQSESSRQPKQPQKGKKTSCVKSLTSERRTLTTLGPLSLCDVGLRSMSSHSPWLSGWGGGYRRLWAGYPLRWRAWDHSLSDMGHFVDRRSQRLGLPAEADLSGGAHPFGVARLHCAVPTRLTPGHHRVGLAPGGAGEMIGASRVGGWMIAGVR